MIGTKRNFEASMSDSPKLPFFNQNDDEFFNEIIPSNHLLIQDRITEIKDITFNLFSSDGRGRKHFAISPYIDPDDNYFSEILRSVDDCDYYDEASLQSLTKTQGKLTFKYQKHYK